MKRILIPLAACIVLVAAGCGGSGNTSSSAPSSTGQSGSTSAPAAKGSVMQIAMKNIQFVPKDATAKVGQTVRWGNEDTVSHDVKATSGASFSSSLFGHGGTYQVKLTKPGKISYVCTIHPGMVGTINVTG
jgi:plastocyanin